MEATAKHGGAEERRRAEAHEFDERREATRTAGLLRRPARRTASLGSVSSFLRVWPLTPSALLSRACYTEVKTALTFEQLRLRRSEIGCKDTKASVEPAQRLAKKEVRIHLG